MLRIPISLRAIALSSAIALSACTVVPPEKTAPPIAPKSEAPKQVLKAVRFADVPGWDKDNLAEAWPAFLSSCEVLIKRVEWQESCSAARDVNGNDEAAIRAFFEAFFVPHQASNADGNDAGLVTGYYEPLLRGSRKRGGLYQTPLYRPPEDLLTIDMGSTYPELKNMRLRGRLVGNKVVPYPSRAELQQSGALTGKELVWVDDPIEAFFLQVQGSGRVHLVDSHETIRLAYADQNGHPYKSIGRYLVDKGELTLDQASAQNIKAWYAANPARRQELLNANSSYVFFREEQVVDPAKGPKGAMGIPLLAKRAIAIDPQFIPLGTPVFLSTSEPATDVPMQRLTIAQDTGGAIKGPLRVDYFWGFGPGTADKAGKMKQQGKVWLLLPTPHAMPAKH